MSVDANANFQQMLNATKLGESGGQADTLEKVVENTASDAAKGAFKILGLGFLDKIFSQGLFKQFESQGWASKKINEGATSLSAGANSKLAGLLDQVGLAAGKISFNVAAAAVEPMQQLEIGRLENIPIEALGQLTPMQTPGMGRSEGMSLA